MRRIRQFYGLLAPYRRLAFFAFCAILCATLLELAFPWAVKLILDDVLVRRDIRLLNIIGAGLAAVFALKFICGFAREYLFALLGESVVRDLRNRLYWHIQRLSVGYREKTATGEMLSGLTGDVDSIRQFLFGGMIDFVFASFTIVFVTAVLLWVNWKLTAVALIFMPFYMITYLKYFPVLREGHGLVRRKFAELTARAAEVFKGMRVVAGYSAEEHEARLFDLKQREIFTAAMKSHRIALLLWMGADLISSLGVAAVVWMGGAMVLSGSLSAGSLVAFYSYLGMLLVPVVRMTVIGNYYQEASAALDRINGVLSRVPEVADAAGSRKVAAIRGDVEFRDVSFAYAPGNEVLSGIRIRIAAGSTVAFCGKSGAGKSTLVNLLLRFYEPSKGAVYVDGEDIRGLELKSFRSRLATVLQDDYLFSGTVKENILYGSPGASDADVAAAAAAANAHDFITRLPGGYDAQVGEGGVRLSFGQRQRISIARAVLRRPSILVLDEATSGVDSETERGIVEDAYRRAMAGRTTLIIAHRLGIIRGADMIVFLSEGRIAESGSHEDLIGRRGHYWKMWSEQNRDGTVAVGQ